MQKWLNNRNHRKWLYGVALAGVPLLVAYGVVSEDAAPLWVAMIGAALAPAVALGHLTPEEDDQAE
jgi:hypothetical protein